MEPTYHDGDRLLVAWGLSPRPGRAAVVSLPPGPDGPRPLAVKRITGRDPADPARWSNSGKFPPCVLTGTTPEMRVRQEEIFGPILPIVPVAGPDQAIATVLADERPLALYWFGTDAAARDRVMVETVSGGVTINDCLVHLAQENQPFGGVGASGQGAYHGEWGFRTFTKLKPIFHRPDLSGLGFMQPPYGKTCDRMLAALRRII